MEKQLSIFRERIAAATNDAIGLCIRAGGSKDWYGQTPVGEVLDVHDYTGIIDYEPTELVITARCGTPLAEIETALAEHNQMLAFEPPHFGAHATIGGAVAAGLSGPGRAAVGALRDFVLGVVLMDGQGQSLHFGGQVMKNVAGYDVSRLLTGSLGTLGLLLEVSVKVLPRPVAEATLQVPMSQGDAIKHLNAWGGQPLPISASLWHEGILNVRLAGAQAAVAAARRLIGGTEADGERLWHAAREQSLPFFAGIDTEHPLWRLSVPSTTPPLDISGPELIEWGGAQRWVRSNAPAAKIRALAVAAGGHATLFRGGDKAVGVFQPLAPAVAAIHRNLKNAFDPHGIFNPGRMYPDL
jgi:glycolate oxidase FAD binding subunit